VSRERDIWARQHILVGRSPVRSGFTNAEKDILGWLAGLKLHIDGLILMKMKRSRPSIRFF
jgi:DNA-binding CsgD family transcriptional regulator